LLVLSIIGAAHPARAQDRPPAAMPLTKVLQEAAKDFVGLASLDSAKVLGIGGAAALAAHPGDRKVNWQLGGGDYEFLDPGTFVGLGALQGGVALATYAVGRSMSPNSRAAWIGQELLRAQLVTGVTTFGLKIASQRSRPDGSDHHSFPSGHASSVFATAAILGGNFGWKVAVPAYLGATYVATSRLHENRHNVSDVIFGSALGIAAGRVTLRRDGARVSAAPVVLPGGAGLQMTW
jgi:membrane-associated phospholipid phosphatase